jgi:hypothetical protein
MVGSTISFKTLMTVLVATLIVGMIGTAIQAHAIDTNSQPYVAGYGKEGDTITSFDETFMRQYFYGKNNAVPNQDLLSVLSIAGASGSTVGAVNGFVYQAVVHWDVDGYIWVDPQTRGPASTGLTYGRTDNLLSLQLELKSLTKYVTTDVELSLSNDKVLYHHTLYRTDGTALGNLNSYNMKTYETTTNFLFGTCNKDTVGGVNECYTGAPRDIKFYQFGVEATGQTGNFDVLQNGFTLYSGTTVIYVKDKQAYLANGNSGAQISWYTDNNFNPPAKTFVQVGGMKFNNVFAQAYSTDPGFTTAKGKVQWDARSCGNTNCQADNTRLW